jgi:hypothetical protein
VVMGLYRYLAVCCVFDVVWVYFGSVVIDVYRQFHEL